MQNHLYRKITCHQSMFYVIKVFTVFTVSLFNLEEEWERGVGKREKANGLCNPPYDIVRMDLEFINTFCTNSCLWEGIPVIYKSL